MRFPIVLVLLAAVLAPATASAKPTIGISDNRYTMFSDPLFSDLGVSDSRLIVSYNAVSAARRGDTELSERVIPYLANAEAQGIDVHVAFEHARGEAFDCDEKPKLSQCRLPGVGAYKSEITKFLKRFPTVDTITAWNEANHNTQPTYKNPRRAGQFGKAAEQACKAAGRPCTVVALDLLDVADDPADTKRPTFKRTVRFAKAARRGYGSKPKVCGIHNYGDANRFRTSGTKALTKAMRCKRVWLTETGGLFKFASFWTKPTKRVGKCSTNANCQVAAMRFLFKKVIRSVRTIDRVYVYNFYSGTDGRFDAGIVKGDGSGPGTKRPAYDFLKRQIAKGR